MWCKEAHLPTQVVMLVQLVVDLCYLSSLGVGISWINCVRYPSIWEL